MIKIEGADLGAGAGLPSRIFPSSSGVGKDMAGISKKQQKISPVLHVIGK